MFNSSRLSTFPIWEVACTAVLLYAAWMVAKGVYNWYFHPLAKFPGPRWASFSPWWKINLEVLQGRNLTDELFRLHAMYGDVVRIGPNELHFAKPNVYHEIYNPHNRWSRDPSLYHVFSISESLLTIMEYPRAKKRKDILQPLFSRKAIIRMQHLIQDMANRMCHNMEEHSRNKTSVDILRAYKCFSLDGITSFCFGTSMNATDAPDFEAPVGEAMHASLPIEPFLKHFPFVKNSLELFPAWVVSTVQPQLSGLMDLREALRNQVKETVAHPEILEQAEHPTIFNNLLDVKDGGRPPSLINLRDEALLMVFAGTDTSSTALTIGTMHILDRPDIHRKLNEELLQVWPNLSDRPTYEALDNLPYLKAVIKESLRLSSGVWSPMTRIVPREGAQIDGHFIPGNTAVGISNLFVHLNANIFPNPHTFEPNRWLQSKDADSESLDHWLVAFSKGPRSCLGLNLGWCQLVLGFANVFRRFQLELDNVNASQMHWQECYIPHYTGPELKIAATPRVS
ncbi:cytochrome P450 [Irpex rosettiformis]|uniref:Cytochrome P450 n=1 Tax=Irpex rosettiformis TaxID=378272 RepID=A0ACB8TRF1_9APHY|nr:cytochrome P450 [Irpex rosettiformis]